MSGVSVPSTSLGETSKTKGLTDDEIEAQLAKLKG